MNRKKFTIIFIISMSLVLVLSGCGKIKERLLEKNNYESTTEQNDKESSGKNTKDVLDSGDYEFTIRQGNIERYYLLHIPKSYRGNPAPLVLSFHGGMGSAEIQQKHYGWVEKSDEEGFIVAFPNGASRFDSGKFATWNAGRCCAYAVESNSDDIGFIKLLIDDIEDKVNIGKVFATGMSNGGMFSHRLACEMSDVFSAVAAVAGTNVYDLCKPTQPISVMHVHGLNDSHVLFEGGCGPDCVTEAETEFTSVADTINGWLEKNVCQNISRRVLENDMGYCDLYSECASGVSIKLCVAKDGGHSWPGITATPNNLEKKNIPSQAFNATDEIWDFFATQ